MRHMIVGMMTASIFAATAAIADDQNAIGQGVSGGDEAATSTQALRAERRDNGSFQAIRARLREDGYRGIRSLDGDPYRLYAFDADGSPVHLLISPENSRLAEVIYIHPMDE